MTEEALQNVSAGALASVGDSVYDLLVRAELVAHGALRAGELHRGRVALVNARTQARDAKRLEPLLTDTESAVFRRGRNAELRNIPSAASRAEYHAATALEALFGWLYLKGDKERLAELFGYLQKNRENYD